MFTQRRVFLFDPQNEFIYLHQRKLEAIAVPLGLETGVSFDAALVSNVSTTLRFHLIALFVQRLPFTNKRTLCAFQVDLYDIELRFRVVQDGLE